MAAVDEARIQRLVEELDGLVQRDGAWVRMEQYGGGPDEGRIVANQTGYLRLGIELLKGGSAPLSGEGGRFVAAVDLRYLITDDSVIGFDEFIRDDSAMPSPPSAAGGLGAMLIGCGCVTAIIATIGFAVVGVRAVIWGW